LKRLFLAFCLLLSTLSPTIGGKGVAAFIERACHVVSEMSAEIEQVALSQYSNFKQVMATDANEVLVLSGSAVEARSENQAASPILASSDSSSSNSSSEEEEEDTSIGDAEDSHLLNFALPLSRIEHSIPYARASSRVPSETESDRLKRPPRFA
jgi:hypothetical protein